MITIEFRNELPLNEIAAEISRLKSPQVVLWYIGSYGLKTEGVRFYRDHVLGPIFKGQKEARFWLVDLTAWGALRDPEVKVHQDSSCVETIEGFGLKCIRASETFQKMQELDPRAVEYFKEALKRDFVHRASEKSPKAGFPIGEVLDCPVVDKNLDAAKCYSALQYLEGCLQIEKIVGENLGKDVNIVFVLPNDELKYYRDETNAFQRDVRFLLEHRFGSRLKDVKVTMFSFEYGEEVSHRPYNAPGKVFKKNELTCHDVLEIDKGATA